MNIANILVMGIILIILVIITTFMLELFIPINQKFQFDKVCSQYVFICDNNNGLTSEQKTQLVDELTALGFTNITYHIPEINEKAFNENYLFDVQGDYAVNPIISLKKRQEKIIHMKYHYQLVNRQVIN
jgi:hypothetical protein